MQRSSLSAIDRQSFPFIMIPKAFFTRFYPTQKATSTYLALKYYTHTESKSCQNISIRTLGRIVGVSEDTIKRGLAELEKKNVVVVRKRSRKSPEGKRIPLPNLYELVDLQEIGGEPI